MTRSRRRWTLISLTTVILIDAVGLGIIFPIMPALFMEAYGFFVEGTAISVRNFHYGLSLAFFPLGSFIGMPFIGSLSDRHGRKRMLLFCLLGVAAGYFCSGGAAEGRLLWLFYLGRFVSGFFAASSAVAMAAIADVSVDLEEKVGNMGWPMLAQVTGFIIGPLITAFTIHPGIDAPGEFMIPFLIAGVVALLNMVFLQAAFRETRIISPEERAAAAGRPGGLFLFQGFVMFKVIFTDRRIRVLGLLFLLIQIGLQEYLESISLILAQQFGYSPGQLGVFFAVMGAGIALAVVGVQPLLKKLSRGREGDPRARPATTGEKPAGRLGLAGSTYYFAILMGILIFAGGIAPGAASQWILCILVGMLSVLLGMRFLTIFSSAVGEAEQGKVMGGVGAIMAASCVIAAYDVGQLMTVSYHLLLITAGLTVIIPALFLKRVAARTLKPVPAP